MKLKRYVTTLVPLVVLNLGIATAVANDVDGDAEGDDPQAVLMSGINANRDGVVREMASIWANQLGEEENSLLYDINALANEKLLKLQDATSPQEARDIIVGKRSNKQARSGGLARLGDVAKDLVYTPVTPCRIIDTRDVGGTGNGSPLAAGASKNYYVHGSGTKMTSQGGTSSGCPAPKGEPSAVHANFTVVPEGTSGTTRGNIRVYPKGAAEPHSSLVNFKLGTVFTNTATIRTCVNCGYDLTIKAQYNATRVVVDVLGYYYPVDKDDADRMALAFAYFDKNGVKKSGTENISATWNSGGKRYELAITGENYFYNKYSAFVTAAQTCTDAIPHAASFGGKLLVSFLDVNGSGEGSKKQCDFQVVVFKNQ